MKSRPSSFPYFGIGIILILVVAGVWWYRHSHHGNDGPLYQTSAVTRGDIVQSVSATGQLNPVVTVQVGSQISGIIEKLNADYNSVVTKEQVIAQIDPATFKAQVTQAQGELDNAIASLKLKETNLKRTQALFNREAAPQSSLDAAKAEYDQARAQVQIREASLERSKVDLARCTIYSPIDGVVISRNVDVGQTVAASLSAPTLFQIAQDLTEMQIIANIAEADIGTIEEGQDVDFTVDAYPTAKFTGKVSQVRNSPITVESVVTYQTVINVKNPDLKLKPGMTANVSIIVAKRHDALLVSNAALRFKPSAEANAKVTPKPADPGADATAPKRDAAQAGGGTEGRRRSGGGGEGGARRGGRRGGKGERPPVKAVYVQEGAPEENRYLKAEVKIGITDGSRTEIVEGLKENQWVLTGESVRGAGGNESASSPFGGGMGGSFRRY